MPSWRVEDVGPQHLAEILALFRDAFGHDMSETHWQWKYGEGRGLGVVVQNTGGQVVAFFGGTERRVLFNGEPLVAIQCGDSMVAPTHRGILTRKGPFYLSVTAFLGQYVGAGLPYLLSYGFPNARAMRLARRLALYDDVGAMLEIDWLPKAEPDLRALEFDFANAQHCRVVAELWSGMAAGFSDRAIGIRDVAYLRQRYLDNPTLSYAYHLVCQGGQGPQPGQRRAGLALAGETVLGLLITRRTDEGLLLVDLVGEAACLSRLIDFARHRAARLACAKLYGWLTERDLPLIAATEPIIERPPLRLPLGVYSPGLTADDVRDKWFFLCGDSDFL